MILYGKLEKLQNKGDKTQMELSFNDEVYYDILRLNEGDEEAKQDIEIHINDGRTITAAQRKKIFAIMRDIAKHVCDEPEQLRHILMYYYCEEKDALPFSLSSGSVTDARNFITFLLETTMRYDIPLSASGIERTDDIDAYLYLCIKYRKCAITGQSNAEIHHCNGSVVGMGMNRRKVDHRKRELIALSHDWHRRVHKQGEKAIFKKYKIYGIKLDEYEEKKLKTYNLEG